jgi:hypothetical protein
MVRGRSLLICGTRSYRSTSDQVIIPGMNLNVGQEVGCLGAERLLESTPLIFLSRLDSLELQRVLKDAQHHHHGFRHVLL